MRGLRPYCGRSVSADQLAVELVEQPEVTPERLAVEELPGVFVLVDRFLHALEEYLRDVLSDFRAHGRVTEALEALAQRDTVLGHGLLDRDFRDANSTGGFLDLSGASPREQTQWRGGDELHLGVGDHVVVDRYEIDDDHSCGVHRAP